MTYYGSGNSGPATQIWRIGDRVRSLSDGAVGVVAHPQRERGAFETQHVWVNWADGWREVVGDYEYRGCFVDPGMLDRV